MTEALYFAYLSSLVLSVAISIYVAYRLFAAPSSIKSKPTKFAIPLSIALGLTLVSWILFAISAAFPRVNISCGVDSYAVPATLGCEALKAGAKAEWRIYPDGDVGKRVIYSGSRFSHAIVEPGKYKVSYSDKSVFLFVALETFSTQDFSFGTPADISGAEVRTVDFKFEKPAFTDRSCDFKRIPAEKDEKIKYAYVKQVQSIDGSVDLYVKQDGVTLVMCFSTGVMTFSPASRLERALVTGQLVVGVENKQL